MVVVTKHLKSKVFTCCSNFIPFNSNNPKLEVLS
jgi:hypothetical protein